MPYSIERSLKRMCSPQFVALIVVAELSLTGCGGGGDGGASSANTGGDPVPGPAQPDTTPPSHPTGLSGIAVSTSEIRLSWSSAAASEGVTNYRIYRNGTVIATIASTSHTDAGLSGGTQYCYDITASDAAGNESAHSAPTCATTALVDTTPPTVTSAQPANDAADIAVDTVIAAVFGEVMNAATLNQATFTLADASDNPVSGTIAYSGTTATFVPSEILAPSETYTATLATDVEDAAGNSLVAPYSWTFKTGLATYELTAVGDDPPDDDEETFTLVNDLNEKGEVAGEAVRIWDLDEEESSQESTAFLWRDGRLIDLGALHESVRDSRAQGVNDHSEVIGWSYPGDGETRPGFRWRNDQLASIGLEDAYAINNAGQVVGYIHRIQGGEAFGVAVVWRADEVTELVGLGNPWNINEAGDVVGFSYVARLPQASLWRAGVVTLLGLLPGALTSQAFDVNAKGQIIGTNEFAPPDSSTEYHRAFHWQSGELIELPRVATSHASSSAYGINDRGHVVGRSGESRFTATIWFDAAVYDLNELIASDDPLKPYITLLEAREINNRGQIIVQGSDSRRSGSYSGYLLTPKGAR